MSGGPATDPRPVRPGGSGPTPPRKRRKRRLDAGEVSVPDAQHSAAATAPATGEPRTKRRKEPRSGAALAALLLFAWGQSLLLFEWVRTNLFDPQGSAHLTLVVPVFGASTLAAVVAVMARRAGRESVGGPLVRGLGLASGLLAVTAVVLAVVLGPHVSQANEGARRLEAVNRVAEVALALEAHARERGSHPVGDATALAAALVPTWLPDAASLRDPWGHDLEYRSLSDGEGYVVISAGRDGELDQPLSAYLEDPARIRTSNDVAVVNGTLFAR